jgi:MoaA/NifB/PqqE/SkfB family radical SAM enzyme
MQKLKKLLKKTKIHKPLKKILFFLLGLKKRRGFERVRTKGLIDIPKAVIFEPTIKCNLNCQMCYQKQERIRGKKDLTLEEIKKIFLNLKKQNKIKKVSLIGAEVFMHPDIFEIIAFLKKLNIKVYIQTNGTLLTKATVERLKKLKNITGIGSSLDGKKELHNKIRGRSDAFDKLFQAINLLKKYFTITINTVIMNENIDQILEIAKLLKQTKVFNYSLQFEMAATPEEVEESGKLLGINISDFAVEVKADNNFSFGLDEILNILKKLNQTKGLDITIQPRIFNKYPEFYLNGTLRENQSNLYCKDIHVIRINAQGEIIFCPFIKKSFGNLLEKKLEQIWNSQNFRDFRVRLLKNNLTPVCKRCCRLGSL